MPDLEGRLTDVEHRVDVVESGVDDVRTARRHDVELLTALRQTQVEQSAVLADHSAVLAEHSTVLAEHTRRFDRIDSALGGLMVDVHAIERIPTRLTEDDEG